MRDFDKLLKMSQPESISDSDQTFLNKTYGHHIFSININGLRALSKVNSYNFRSIKSIKDLKVTQCFMPKALTLPYKIMSETFTHYSYESADYYVFSKQTRIPKGSVDKGIVVCNQIPEKVRVTMFGKLLATIPHTGKAKSVNASLTLYESSIISDQVRDEITEVLINYHLAGESLKEITQKLVAANDVKKIRVLFEKGPAYQFIEYSETHGIVPLKNTKKN